MSLKTIMHCSNLFCFRCIPFSKNRQDMGISVNSGIGQVDSRFFNWLGCEELKYSKKGKMKILSNVKNYEIDWKVPNKRISK